MSEVIAPAVRTLDYGYQSANPIDYQRAGSALMEPFTRAVEAGNETKNRFLLQQIADAHSSQINERNIAAARAINDNNNDRAMQVAQWNNDRAMEQQAARDKASLAVQKMKSDALLASGKQRAHLTAVAAAAQRLADIGVAPPDDFDPDSPEAIGQLNGIYNVRSKEVTKADAQLIARTMIQKQQIEQRLNDPQAQAVDASATKAISEMAGGYAMSKFPGMTREQILNDPALKAQFLGEYNLAAGQAELQWRQKNPEAAMAREQYKGLVKQWQGMDADLTSKSRMSGANGRTVPKPTWNESVNMAHDVLDGKTLEVDGKTQTRDVWFPSLFKPSAGAGAVKPAGNAGDIRALKELPPTTAPAAVPAGAAANPVTPPVTFANSGAVGVTADAWHNFLYNNSQLGATWDKAVGPAGPGALSLKDAVMATPGAVANGGVALGRAGAWLVPGQPENQRMIQGFHQFLYGQPPQPAPQPVMVASQPQPQVIVPPQMLPPLPNYTGAPYDSRAAYFDPNAILNRAPSAAEVNASFQPDYSYGSPVLQ